MCLDELINVVKIITCIVAVAGIYLTYKTFNNTNKIKRGEWLKDLFEKFYEEKNFAVIRKEIDYDRIEKYLGINEKSETTNDNKEEELVNYLNFFEFISMLVERKHLRKDEMKDLFGYYLELLNKNEFIKKYIYKYSFENLEKLLKNYE